MNDTTITPVILAATDAQTNSIPAKRGRKPETPAQRLERLEKAVAEARVAAKEAERRMFCIVGEALLAEAEQDAALKGRITAILRERVTSAGAKADIAGLLAG